MERDLRSCSGPWTGFWILELTRGLMKLSLNFTASAVQGSGRDPIGEFVINGMFCDNTWKVMFTKTYGSHTVDYSGTWDGNMIYGRWHLEDAVYSESGDFEIWPDQSTEEAGTIEEQLGEILSMPAG